MELSVYRERYENFLYNIAWLKKRHGLSEEKRVQLLGIGIGSFRKIEAGEIPRRLEVRIQFNIWTNFGIPIKDQLEKRLED